MIQTVWGVGYKLKLASRMKRLNNVVVKLWLTIILIVTTVLILLSAALITFFQYYFTQETERALYQSAENVNQVLLKKMIIENSPLNIVKLC